MKTTTVTIKGTHCKSCKLLIEDVCGEIKGVTSCAVDFQTGEAVIEHDENFDVRALKKEIEGLGRYTVEINS